MRMALFAKLGTNMKRIPTSFGIPLALRQIPPPPPPSYTSVSTHSKIQFFELHHLPLKPHSDQTLQETIPFTIRGDEIKEQGFPLDGVLELLRKTENFSSEEAMDFLLASDIHLTGNLVCSVIWALKHEWELALLAFRWGENLNCCKNTRAWDLMVWVLGQQRRFATAWRLIRTMLRSSMDTRKSLLIMIESYAVANNPTKSIQTFQAMEKFRIPQDPEALHTLLAALCRNGNIDEAEQFMHLNKSLFPLQTESFNIILNGWCNISLDLIEAKRVWREMSSCCIIPDDTSYAHMISCFAKVDNLMNSLRLYDEMKKKGLVSGLGVYNSLIYVLTRNNCLDQALNIVDKIKEAGLQPDSTTYNSMIVPLCEAEKLQKARSLLVEMIEGGIKPTTETYHAFVEVEESADGTAELLREMKEAGCGPCDHTFLLIINKFLESKQPDDALRMWVEMMKYEVVPGSAHYSLMVRGLVVCGWVAKAKKFYDDMKLRGFSQDPKINKLLKTARQETEGIPISTSTYTSGDNRSKERKQIQRVVS